MDTLFVDTPFGPARIRPAVKLYVGPVGGLQNLCMLGRWAVPKTLEIKEKILT